MDNQRLFLWAALAFILFLNYQAWVRDFAPAPEAAPPSVGQEAPVSETPDVPSIPSAPADRDELPSMPAAGEADELPSTPAVVGPEAQGATVRVRTDVLDILIDTRSGNLVQADVLDYPVHKDQPDVPVRLLDASQDERFIIQSGFIAASGPVASVFATEALEYALAPGADELSVSLPWEDGNGLSGVKTYTFHRGRYDIAIQQEIRNDTGADWSGGRYVQIRRRDKALKRSMFNVETYSYRGPVLYDGDRYEKLDVDDLAEQPIDETLTNGWIAVIQHHFLAAAVPPADEAFSYQVRQSDGSYLLSIAEAVAVPAGGQGVFEDTLFVGPKVQDQLKAVSPKLDLTVDYGWLTILAQPLFWLLSWVDSWVGNWGWSIIIVTILIKLLFYKLTEMSGRSMARMRKLQPRMKLLQERYKDDREALSKAMMEMYRREKVNPVAGCLPMLIQIPFFLAFYWVLLESVELRQAPFMLWIDDLSVRDPYFVLPLLMGAAMFVQFKLNPAPPDPMQARIMMIMPIMMTGLMAFFPAGLVLYWLTNTLLSILQQWRINKVVGAESNA